VWGKLAQLRFNCGVRIISQNSKHEARNPKQAQMMEIKNAPNLTLLPSLEIRALNLFRADLRFAAVPGFGFRICI
jgi:hypothetical protein